MNTVQSLAHDNTYSTPFILELDFSLVKNEQSVFTRILPSHKNILHLYYDYQLSMTTLFYSVICKSRLNYLNATK